MLWNFKTSDWDSKSDQKKVGIQSIFIKKNSGITLGLDNFDMTLEFQTRAIGMAGVGLSLDPEGRKRLLVRGNSFALKNRDRSFWTFSFLIFFSLKPHFFEHFFLAFLK